MAEAIVERLEAVDVQQQKREVSTVALHPFMLPGQDVLEMAVIVATWEAVANAGLPGALVVAQILDGNGREPCVAGEQRHVLRPERLRCEAADVQQP